MVSSVYPGFAATGSSICALDVIRYELRELQYRLEAGEAGWVLRLDRAIEP